jgi:PAS domain S-box-containing protein
MRYPLPAPSSDPDPPPKSATSAAPRFAFAEDRFARASRIALRALGVRFCVAFSAKEDHGVIGGSQGFDSSVDFGPEALVASIGSLELGMVFRGEARPPSHRDDAPLAVLAVPVEGPEQLVWGGLVVGDWGRSWSQTDEDTLLDIAANLSDLMRSDQRAMAQDPPEADESPYFRASPLGRIRIDLSRRQVIEVDHPLGAAMGYSPEEVLTFAGRPVSELVHPEDLCEFLDHLACLGSGEAARQIETRLRHGNGTWRFCRIASSVARRDESGRPMESTHELVARGALDSAEAKLERSELLSLGNRDAVLLLRPTDGRIVDVNDTAPLIYGKSKEDLLTGYMNDLEAEVPVDLRCPYNLVFSTLDPAFEGIHQRGDGTTFPVEVISQPVTFENEPLMMLTIRDISDRKRAEDLGRLEEERFRLAAEVTFGICYEVDLRHDLAYAISGRMSQLLGYPEYEVESTFSWWKDRIHPEDRSRIEAHWTPRHVKESDRYSLEYRMMRRDGREIWVQDRGFRFCDNSGESYRLLGCATDITERKVAEKRLREKSERLRILSDTVRHLLSSSEPREFIGRLFAELAQKLELEFYFNYVVTEDGKQLRLDSSLGLSGEVVETIRHIEIGQGFCGCVAKNWRAEVIEGPAIEHDTRCELIRLLGLKVYACFPLLAGERLLGTLGFGSSKRSEFTPEEVDMLQSICDQVGMAMERLELLNRSRQQAEQLREDDRRKDEFLAMLAHELRNPLTAIQGAAQLLEMPNLPESDLRWSQEVISRQVTHLAHLIGDLLDISRITRGKILLRKQRTDLRPIMSRAVESTRLQLEAKEHLLSLCVPEEALPVDVDPTRIEQILINLLSNAIKYTDPKGCISLRVWKEEADVHIQVTDNGVGISDGMISRVFDLFTQVDRSLDRSQGGLGIGLALVKRLAEMHGGTISARSEGPGRGSQFTLRLPLSTVETERRDSFHSEEEEKPPCPATGNARVLIVDDNEDVANGLARSLQSWGFDTLVAFDGLSGIQLAVDSKPDVAILDIGLPGLAGYEVAETLIQKHGMHDTFFIACSGYSQPATLERSKLAGFHRHLVKPVDHGLLVRLIQSRLANDDATLN